MLFTSFSGGRIRKKYFWDVERKFEFDNEGTQKHSVGVLPKLVRNE